MKRGDFRFGREYRLLKKYEFAKVIKKGKRSRGSKLEFIYMANELGKSRLGLIVSKKIGKAVARNKLRRTIREAFRINKSLFERNIDLVIRPCLGYSPGSYSELETEFRNFANRLISPNAC